MGMMYIPESVIWQSPDGTWNLGVYRVFQSVEERWEIDEVLDDFTFVSSDHSTVESAENSWKGLINEDDFIIAYDESTKDEIEHLENLKQVFFDRKTQTGEPCKAFA